MNRSMSRQGNRVRGGQPFSIASASLCSLAIALWGWHTGLLFVAAPIILILEARHVIKQRWTLSLSDLKEAAKLCAALLAILFVVLVTVKKSVFIYSLLQWLPVAALPLLIAQTYGLGVQSLLREQFANPHVKRHLSSVAASQKPHLKNQPSQSAHHPQLDIHTLYFGVCLIAASAADSDHFFFYGGAAVLMALFLWPFRPRRTSLVLWCLLFCLSAGLGFAGHRQLAHLQQQLEAKVIAMIGDMSSGAVNPDGTATRMGSLGRLKLSNKIAFRVDAEALDVEETDAETPDAAPTFPLLLQEATYNHYRLSTWEAIESLFSDVPPGEAEGEWILGPAAEQDKTITISTDLARGDGVLTLPRGVSAIQQLPVKEMQRNQYGAVQVDATGDTAYQVRFHANDLSDTLSAEAIPTAADLQIPNADKAAIEQTLTGLSLQGRTEREIVTKIAAHFQTFQYSLDLLQPAAQTTAVSDFLLNTQAGHCEYFASATALLLRGAGIPARYVVGYSVHEFSPLEGQYIVRSRDAHAWTLFYLDGRWQVLDTTPPDWAAQDKAQSSPLQIVSDFFAFLGFQLSFGMRQLGELGLREVLMIVIPLFCYLLWRSIQVFQGQKNQPADELESAQALAWQPNGLDSELFAIEAQLVDYRRLPEESFLQWSDRIKPTLNHSQWQILKEIITLHYCYRFDPHSLNDMERQQLRTLSGKWDKESLYED
ncbi:MAG: transglutaminase-like domain-containing protein [Cyanobacteria bacterium J06629_19]